VKLFDAHIQYYMVAVARKFEFMACNIEVTSTLYSILDGSTVRTFEVMCLLAI